MKTNSTGVASGLWPETNPPNRRTAPTLHLFLLSAFSISALLLGGCARFILPSAKQLDSLAKDPNSIRLKVATIYGTMDLERNMDRYSSAPTNSDITLTPTTTIKVRQ